MLVEDFRDIPQIVGLYHMKSSFEDHSDKIKFLYKFVPGVAPQSFGIYVAKLAGVYVNYSSNVIFILGSSIGISKEKVRVIQYQNRLANKKS